MQLLSIGMLISAVLINIPKDKVALQPWTRGASRPLNRWCLVQKWQRKPLKILLEADIKSLISDLITKGQARPTSSASRVHI